MAETTWINRQSFRIDAEQVSAARAAVDRWMEGEAYQPEPASAFGSTDIALLVERFADAGFVAVADKADRIIGVENTDTGVGDDDILRAVAPFVTPGSFIEFECDGDHWRLEFDGTTVASLEGRIVFG